MPLARDFGEMVEGMWGLVVAIGLIAFVAVAVWRVIRLMGRRDDSAEEAKPDVRLCHQCGYDLRESPHRCPECGALVFDRHRYLRSLGHDWPANPIKPRAADIGERLVVLMSTQDAMEADLLRQQLEARGITAVHEGTQEGGFVYPGTQRATFERVKVYEGDLAAAQSYLARTQGIPSEMWEEWLEHNRVVATRVVSNGDI